MAQDVPHHAKQASFPGMCPVEEALESLAESGSEERGAIFTRCEVVELILDLVGYTASWPLHKLRLLEPAFGDGAFLLLAIGRLLTAWKSATGRDDPVDALSDAIRAVELHGHTFAATREKVLAALKADGIAGKAAVTLVDHWLINADFLLTPLPHSFHCVVGNPPYVRQELIPDALLAEYRTRYSTVFDRADLYVPFIERSLTCLESGGALGFICADRWIKNRYGGPLRKLIADRFHLRGLCRYGRDPRLSYERERLSSDHDYWQRAAGQDPRSTASRHQGGPAQSPESGAPVTRYPGSGEWGAGIGQGCHRRRALDSGVL